MANDAYTNEDLTREMERLCSVKPHLFTLLKAFGPLLLEKEQWLLDTAINRQTVSIDPFRFADGVPVNQQHPIFLENDPWGSAGWSSAKAISQGFPQFKGDMDVLLLRFTEGKYDCFSLFFIDGKEADQQLTDKAMELGVSPLSLHFFLRVFKRFMLTKKARDMQTELATHTWKKGYCPVCGGFPHLAILGDQGQRMLQCADCGHSWAFARLTCPYCDHEDPQNTNIFFIDGQLEDSAFTCDQCRRYLLTANRSSSLATPPADLIAMGLIHLDLILQAKGYRPMAECEWNTFDAAKE